MHIVGLDYFRGFFAFLILICHINQIFFYPLLVFIICGVCSYYVNSKKSISIKILNYTLILLVFASLFFLFYYGLNIVIPYNDDLHYIFMVINSAIMMFVYVLYIHNKKLFFQKFFVDISKYSYSLYIIHFPILLFLFSLFHSKLINYGFLELIFVGVMLLYVVSKFSKYFSFIFERNYFGK